MSSDYTPFEIVTTAIITRDGKYLITQRSAQKKRFPLMWTVPGGHLEPDDFTALPKDTEHYWYNVLEQALRREVQEEIGLEIDRVRYVTSLATIHPDGAPSLVISCLADYVSGEPKLQPGESDDYAWVTLEETHSYELIDGIYDELAMAEDVRLGRPVQWKRADH